MISKTFTACIEGFQGQLVVLEASRQNSLPQIHITGLPSAVVQESRERVRASLNHLGFDTPSRKILIHLSPAETKKTGSHFDFAIAMAMLAVEGFFPVEKIQNCAFLGELTLSGDLRPVSQFVPLLEAILKDERISRVFVPFENQFESHLFFSKKTVHCHNLKEAIQICFQNAPPIQPHEVDASILLKQALKPLSMDQIVGLEQAKRTLTIALAGSHPLLLEGPPGSGKTLLSHSAAGLLPPLSKSEMIEVSRIYSFFGEHREGNPFRPFRSPHHSISASAFLGGGRSQIVPGELSLSHHGLLFLDELPEFRRDAIEGLREPLQSGEIHLHRISRSVKLPAAFSLIAAMNPCPCGYLYSNQQDCCCTPESIRNYRKKISGPILDRFPLYLWMESNQRKNETKLKSAQQMKDEIATTRETLRMLSAHTLGWVQLKHRLDQSASVWLSKWEEESRLSFRRVENALRVGLTLACLQKRDIITSTDLDEARALRSPESLL